MYKIEAKENGVIESISDGVTTLDLATLLPDLVVTVGPNENTLRIGSPKCATQLVINRGEGLIDRITRAGVDAQATINTAYMTMTHDSQVAARQALATLTAKGELQALGDREADAMLAMRISCMVYHNETNLEYILKQANEGTLDLGSYVLDFLIKFYGVCNLIPSVDYSTFPLENVFAWDTDEIRNWISTNSY